MCGSADFYVRDGTNNKHASGHGIAVLRVLGFESDGSNADPSLSTDQSMSDCISTLALLFGGCCRCARLPARPIL